MSFASRERAALVVTMRAVGPDAPTLCEGWTARDLLAHLLLRERRLDSAAGILLPFFAGRTRRVQNQIASQDWDSMLAKLDGGAPWWSPMSWADALVNGLEMFVHHEDVRRAQDGWRPRQLSVGEQCWLSLFLVVGLFTYRQSPVRVVVAVRGGPRFVAKPFRPSTVRLLGEPSELLLHALGRNSVELDYSGDIGDIALLDSAARAV
ncbi:TIGR03085 family metal-binding protein [Gordonia sp. CPCC 205333]|uniref:TIGR03085 family metal-binding protein n=1 Tax=Gordonia sp. CPCC 205333 TaxID=3140790 RepID=UPI003AF341A4